MTANGSTPKTKAAPTLRHIYVEAETGPFVFAIPDTWKLTYGYLQGPPQGYEGGKNGKTLRVYEARDKQRAVFHGVTSFRDLSIPLVRYNKNEKKWEQDSPDPISEEVLEVIF